MSLREALSDVRAAGYDRRATLAQPVFDRLDSLALEIQRLTPSHYLVPVSRGVGALPVGLWVSVLDPDVTTSPTRGTYVVYLFNDSLDRVALSLNQGVTNARQAARQQGLRVRELLRKQAALMRSVLGNQVADLDDEIMLGRGGLLPDYEAGNAVARSWPLSSLPAHNQLADELLRFLDLYAQVVPALEHLRDSGSAAAIPPRDPAVTLDERERRFVPKDASDYRAHIGEHEQVRTRSHENLIRTLGEWVTTRGYEPNTNVHPRDLTLHAPEEELLVEVKIFPVGRPRRSVRECIGQLFEYKQFYQDGSTKLVAALSANPGGAYLELLTNLGIAAMWTEGKSWKGTELAHSYGLVD
jgi:hypothetical protein